MNKRNFASDNNAGIAPEILKGITEINTGHQTAYGDDIYTASATKKFKEHFGADCEIYFVFNGTAANVLSLKTLTDSYNSIICSEYAHINVDECNAPEKFTGCKLLTIPSADGKINVEQIKEHMHGIGDQHHAQPRVISITQSTEFGTVYKPSEIQELADYAHKNDMYLHMDGARLANAAVSLNLGLKEITGDLGVDALSFGGTKNGLMLGEAVVFFNRKLSRNFKFIRKQGMQLASKMRFISIQFETLLTNNLWQKNASHANKMAQLLYSQIKDIPGLKITQKVEANGIFAVLPREVVPLLQEKYYFYIWNADKSEVRLMCSFDTTEEDVMDFSRLIKQSIQ
jgi:threonine aldolase